MYLVNESSLLEPVKRVYKTREKSQSLLDHPRNSNKHNILFELNLFELLLYVPFISHGHVSMFPPFHEIFIHHYFQSLYV